MTFQVEKNNSAQVKILHIQEVNMTVISNVQNFEKSRENTDSIGCYLRTE